MKISYSNYPILEKFNTGLLGNVPIYESDFEDINFEKWVECLKSLFKGMKNRGFCKSIIYTSMPFLQAALQNAKKLMELANDIVTNRLDDVLINSTFITANYVHYFYYKAPKIGDEVELYYMQFEKHGQPVCFYHQINSDEVWWLTKSIAKDLKGISVKEWIQVEYLKMATVHFFKEFAEVETKFIGANKTVKEIGCKYVNDTKLDITYLDSKWFTNLVKSEGFNVRGHFRLQPFGEGLKQRKLIWINDFEKSGYTAKARILL